MNYALIHVPKPEAVVVGLDKICSYVVGSEGRATRHRTTSTQTTGRETIIAAQKSFSPCTASSEKGAAAGTTAHAGRESIVYNLQNSVKKPAARCICIIFLRM